MKDSIVFCEIVLLDVPQCVSCEAWAGGVPVSLERDAILRAGHQV